MTLLFSALMLLCVITQTVAIVKTEKSIVLDYQDIAAGMHYSGTCDINCIVYATGMESAENLLSNIRVKHGSVTATLAHLALKATRTGEKVSIEIPAKTDYTITNENPSDSAATPFYIFITTDPSPLMVLDAALVSRVRSNRTVLIMSALPLLTIHSIYIGSVESVSVSVAAPDSSVSLMSITAMAPPGSSIAKLFSPIASVKPGRQGAEFSFIVDAQQGCDLHFDRGALFAFSSPGNAARQEDAVYAHALIGQNVDCLFSTKCGDDIWTDVTYGYSNVTQASIVYRQANGHEPVKLRMVGVIGQVKTGNVAKDIMLHWDRGNHGFARLEAVFVADARGPSSTTTSAPTTTSLITSETPTTSDTSKSSLPIISCIIISWRYYIECSFNMQ